MSALHLIGCLRSFGVAGKDKKPVLLAAVNAIDRKASCVGLWSVRDDYALLKTVPVSTKNITSVHVEYAMTVQTFNELHS